MNHSLLAIVVSLLSVGASGSLMGADACCAPPARGNPENAQVAGPARMMLGSYEKVSDALAADDLKSAQAAAQTFAAVADITGIDLGCTGVMSGCDGDSGCDAAKASGCTKSLQALIEAEDLEQAREHFKGLSAQAMELAKAEKGFYVMRCPMAGKDAFWLQSDPEIRNPYHGSSMLRCGVVVSGEEA